MVGRLPLRPLRKKVTANAVTYSIDRLHDDDGFGEQTYGTDGYGDDDLSYGGGKSYTEDATSASLYLFNESEEPIITDSGKSIRGSLSGLCQTDADVEEGDRLTHGDGRYELEVKNGVPNDHNPSLYKLRFKRL